MPKRSRTKPRPKRSKPRRTSPKSYRPKADPNRAAFAVLQKVIQDTEGTGKNPLAVALGRLGGLKGGKSLRDKMTPQERHDSAARAARARWAK